MTFRKAYLCISILALAGLSAIAGETRTWKAASGNFSVEGELVRVNDPPGTVALRRKDGKEITIPRDTLNDADRRYIDEHEKQLTENTDGQRSAGNRAASLEPVQKVKQKWAVLIGVNEYQYLNDLKYCGADVSALGKRLLTAGFEKDHVIVLHDESPRNLQPDKSKITDQLSIMLDAVKEGDLVIIAFSGHGVRIGGKSYLCPCEAKVDGASVEVNTLIPLDWLYDRLRACRASVKLFLVDACQNQLLPGSQKSVESARSVEDFAKSLDRPPEGILLLTACAPGEFSREDSKLGHGVYMNFVLQALDGRADANHDGTVSLKEMDLFASDKTRDYVQKTFSATQRPSLKGELQGDVSLAECLKMDRITVPDDIDSLPVAIERAAPGATIMIRRGLYRYEKPLRLSNEVTIIGEGEAKDVTLECTTGSAIIMATDRAKIQNLSLRSRAKGEAMDAASYVVQISQGKSEIIKCDIASDSANGVWISGNGVAPELSECNIHELKDHAIHVDNGANPTIVNCILRGNGREDSMICIRVLGRSNPIVRGCIVAAGYLGISMSDGSGGTFSDCKIHGHQQAGINVEDDGTKGTFENCDIYDNIKGEWERAGLLAGSHANVAVCYGADPTVRNSKIHDSKENGVVVMLGGKGTFDNCDIFRNRFEGVMISSTKLYRSTISASSGAGCPTFTHCRIYDGKSCGVYVGDKGKGTFEDCDIYGNMNEVIVCEEGNPLFRGCTIRDGRGSGVKVHENGTGTWDSCSIYGTHGALGICTGGNPTVKQCKLYDGKGQYALVIVFDNGKGVIQNCDIYGNDNSDGIDVMTEGNPLIKDCKIRDGKGVGVYVYTKGKGTFERCDISGNERSGLQVESEGNPIVKDCKIRDNKMAGIFVCDKGMGTFEKCRLWGNASGQWSIRNDAGAVTRTGNSPNQ